MLRFFVFAFFAIASAEVFGEGPCPAVELVENFNFSAYKGTWYEIAKFPNAGEEGANGKCTTAEYTVSSADKGKVKSTHVIDGVKSYIEGDVTLVEPGKMMYTYTFGGVSKNSYLMILDTDYNSYAIGYSCKYFEKNNNHQVFSWILSRSKTLEGDAKVKVDEYLKNTKLIDVSKYIYNDQSEEACKSTVTKAVNEFIKQ